MVDCVKDQWFLGVWKLVFVLEASLGCLLSCFHFSLFLLVHLYVLHCKLHSGYPYVFLHIQAQVTGEVDILHGSEMRDGPLGLPVFLPAMQCCCCHRLYFMYLAPSSLSAPNAFVCVSSLFYLQIPPCHHKKVRQPSITHLWLPVHFQMAAVWLCCFLCFCEMKKHTTPLLMLL